MSLPALQRSRSMPAARTVQPEPSPSLGELFMRWGLHGDLAAVERRLLERTASHAAVLTDAGAYTIAAGGKRLRAALVLLSARLGNYDLERAVHPAASIELLHAASLIHDDLVDHTDRRRGRVTVHARWDNTVALMLGDYMFALSAAELALEPDPRVMRFYAEAAHTVVEGELSPVTTLEPLDVALEQYRYKIGCKTAALFVAACKTGGVVSGATPEQIEALGRFGYDLGLAFQIVDDVLDFTGDEALLGKPAGNDLREGTWTLPLIYAVATSQNPLLRELARTGVAEPARVPRLVEAVIAEGGVDHAMDEAYATAQRALQQLDIYPASPVKRAFADICDFVLARHT